jgi:RecA/RadA recombinase
MGRLPKDKETNPTSGVAINAVVNDVLKQFSEQNLNNINIPSYKVSSGSLNFDAKIDGGITPSLVRMSGGTESGKTSATLSFLANFLKPVTNRYGVYVDAECRLNEKIRARTPIKFVYTPEEFVEGTCFVLTTTSYNMAIELLRQLVKTNMGNDKRFFFVIDSIDSLITDETAEINAEEVNQIAGMQKAGLTTRFLERFSSAMRRCGHFGVFISQVRTKVAPMYAKPDGNFNLVTSSGAHKLAHDADWVFEFESHLAKKHLIVEKGTEEKIIGHVCRVTMRKTQNDTTGSTIEYPIRRNAPPGKAVWKEREIFDQLLAFGKLSKKGAWFGVDESVIKLLAEKNLKIENQYQGEDSFVEFLEENEQITDILYQYLLEILFAVNSEI